MDRWTQEELKNTDDLSFAIQILYERRKGLNPYAPLYQKLSQTVSTLNTIREEKRKVPCPDSTRDRGGTQ